ncbi:MAG: YjjG family noncanonical pyrimidine nucleotidase [Bacilli bacterium]|nr:YjjG family noncanonical pyrimidine nucleotidase [Bacilli bacterium]MDD3422712.1 YjjG family noncanonical pyrimidine nucleotidase [Bacilli bacterium]MDD4065870.1 YjjG family noncanonical pyrimidine nucleotidase [Bacilli bacterium]
MAKIVLIDLDNTLLNFDIAEKLAFKYTALRYGLDYSEDFYQEFLKVNSEYWRKSERGEISIKDLTVQRFADVFNKYKEDLDPVKVNQTYLQQLSDHPYYEEGSVELLKYLGTKYKVFIVTNGVYFVQRRRLDITHLDDLVTGVICSEQVGANKPSPDFFIKGLKEYGLDATKSDDFIIIGDSLTSDMLGGETMGYETIWYNRKHLDPNTQMIKKPLTYIVTSLQEIEKIL